VTRVRGVFKPADYSGPPDEATMRDLARLFDRICPGDPDPQFHGSQAGWAILAAQSPKLALMVLELTEYIARETAWCGRRDLRELAIQTVNLHYRCEFSFRSHLAYARDAGVGAELLAAIPYWRTSSLFDDEQRLVIEYANAVLSGDVPDALFARAVEAYGEKGVIEFTSVVGCWSFWAMLLNATRPEFAPKV